MKRKLCLLMLIVTVYKSQGFGHNALKGGSYSGSYSSSSASSAASSFSSSYSSGGALDLGQLKHAGLAGSSAFAHAGAGAGAGAGAWAGAGAGAGSVAGSGTGTYGSKGGCGGTVCSSNNAGAGSGHGVADSEEGNNIIPGSGSKPGAYSNYADSVSGASNSGAVFPIGHGAPQSSSGSYVGASSGTYSPNNKDVSSGQPSAYRPVHSSTTEEDDGSYKPPGANGKSNAGAYSSGQVAGPFPGPQGSIHDSKPAPPGGGGPDPAWLTSGNPAPVLSDTKISGLSPSLISSLPGAPGSIHSSKPSGPSAFSNKPSSCGPNNPSCLYKPTGTNGCSPSNPNCGTNGAHGTATSSASTSGGHYDGSYPGSPVSFHNSKPIPSSSVGCGPSNPNCAQKPGTASFPSSRPSNVNINGCSPSNPNCNYYPTSSTGTKGVAASAGAISSGGHFASSTPGIPGSSYAANGAGNNGCRPSNPNCNNYPASSPGTSYNGGHFSGTLPGTQGSIHTSKPAPSNAGCGPSNPNCSQKPTFTASYPSSSPGTSSNGGHFVGTLPGAPGSIHTSKPAPSNGGCGPSNPNCSQKPTITPSYPSSSPGTSSNGGHFVGTLPGAPGSIHTSKPAPSNGGCGPSNPNCSQKPIVISSYPSSPDASPNGGYFGTLPTAPGNIHTSKPAPASGCGPFNPTCSNKTTKTPGYPQTSPVTTGFSHVVHKLPGPKGSIHDSKPAPISGNKSVFPPLVHDVNPSVPENKYAGSLPGSPSGCTKAGGCSALPYNGVQNTANAAADTGAIAGSPRPLNSYNGPSSQPIKPIYEPSAESSPESSDNKPSDSTVSSGSEPHPQNPSSDTSSEAPVTYTSNSVVLPYVPSSGIYQTNYSPNGLVSDSKHVTCPFGSPDCLVKPSQPVDKPIAPDSNVEPSIAYPGTGNLPVSDSTVGSYPPDNKETENRPGSPSFSCVGTACQKPSSGGKSSGSGGFANAGAGAGSFGNGYQGTYSVKPTSGCKGGSCGGSYPAQPSSGCVGGSCASTYPSKPIGTCSGGACGVVSPGKPSTVYPSQPSSGSSAATYPGAPSSGCSGANCGGGANGYSSSPASGTDDGFATGSVLIHKGNGDISYGNDNPGSYSYSRKPAGGCTTGSCGSGADDKEIEKSPPGSLSFSQLKPGCVGTTCQNPSSGGKPSGPGGYANAGADTGSFGNGYQGTYSGKPSGGCKGGSCGDSYSSQPSSGCVGGSCTSSYPSKPTGGCIGGACGIVSSGKQSSVYPDQPPSGSLVTNYPAVPYIGCSGGSCGGGANDYSGSPTSDSDDGFATGSVLVHKGNGDISYGNDNPGSYSYSGKPAGGCSGGACGHSGVSSGYTGAGGVGTYGVSSQGTSGNNGCSGGTCGSGSIGGSHAASGSFSGSGLAGGSGCGSGKCGDQVFPAFGGGFGASGAYSSAGSGAGFGLPDLLGSKGLNGAFSKAFSGSGSFAKAGASAASYSGAVAGSSSGSYSGHH